AIRKDQQEKEGYRLTCELQERVKELSLLRRVTQTLLAERPLGQGLLDDLVEVISIGWSPPERCQVRLAYDKWEAKTANYAEVTVPLTRALVTTQASGLLEIQCLNPSLEMGAPCPSREMLQLLDSIGETLAIHFSHAQAEEALRESEERYRLVNLATSD